MKPIWALLLSLEFLACLVLYVPGFVAVTQPEPQKTQSVDRNQIPNWPYEPDGSRVYSDSDEPPFDVPPVMVPMKTVTLDNGAKLDLPDYETCADKTRFLLHSEDGKGHCLRLVPHD